MKRNLMKGVVLLLSGMMFFGLFGCKGGDNGERGSLESISMSCAHMDYSASYNFFLRQEGDEILLDAEFFPPYDAQTNEYPERIEIENAVVTDKTALERASEIADRHNVYKFLKTYKKPIRIFQALDETAYGFAAKWGGKLYSASAVNSAESELKEFFTDLAMNSVETMQTGEESND